MGGIDRGRSETAIRYGSFIGRDVVTDSYDATTGVVGASLSSLQLFPDLVTVEPLPWYAYATVVVLAALVVGVIRLELLHYRSVQVGRLIPVETVDRMLAAKDAEIANLKDEVARWVGSYHIADAAYKELSGSIDENTDALRALALGAGSARSTQPPPTRTNSEATNDARRRRDGGR